MNIEKLLKKLDKNTIENKKQLLSVQGAYNLKTSESIGTLNSVHDLNERSFVISDTVTPQNKKFGLEGLLGNSKLDEQLLNIQKMKNLYESRKNKNRIKTKSIERNSTSGQKSKQKHLLKPSKTPSFNKIEKSKHVEPENDSACKNLYGQQMLDGSQVSNASVCHTKVTYIKGGQKNCYQYPNSSLHVQDPQQQPYEEQPSYNEPSLSQIANISQDIPHESIHKIARRNEHNNSDQTWQDSNINSNYGEIKKKIQLSQPENCSCKCMGREEIGAMMSKFQQRMEGITLRLRELQEENQRMRCFQAELQNQNNKLQEELIQSNQQKQKTVQQLKRQQQQKQQLQVLLKDVLYKRQRQKLQSSKQNTHRENEKNDKKIHNLSFAQNQSQSQSTSQLKIRTANSMNSKPRQSDSKMKVQNLLHKLQIRVDRN